MESLPKTIIYIFIDGIGFGEDNPQINPFAKYASRFFSILGGASWQDYPGIVLRADAQMGIPGLPQSATGQTALFTGYNGPALLKRHVNGYPTFTLRPYLKDKSILKVFQENGRKATLINAYSGWYFEKLKNSPRKERLMSASTMIQYGTGLPFFTLEDLKNNKSIYMDITHWFLRKRGYDIEIKDPVERGRTLVKIARDYDLILYEYFLTDKAGHSGQWEMAKKNITILDKFLQGVWEEMDTEKELVIISSDHGNMEDLSVTTHTPHPVPVILHGKGESFLADGLEYLYDIPRKVYQLLDISSEWNKK